jgi:hypothetical protein
MHYLKHIYIPLFLFVVGCSFEDKTLLTIGEDEYTVADFNERYQFAPADDSVKRMNLIDDYINQMLVFTEAKEQGYDDDPVVKTALETNQRDVIWRSYYSDVILGKIKVGDTEVRDTYNKIVEQYHLAQIVVAEESLANYVSNELKKGASFDDMLVFSLDTMSAGGDIGTFSIMSIPPEITISLKKVKEGGVTEPIHFGEYYMIFKVIEHMIAESPKYDDVKENIRNNLRQEKARAEGEKYFDKLTERARVEYNPEGLDILLKPESLITESDLNTWVVKKYDTAFVYVRSVIDAVRYLHAGSQVDPKYLIEQELIPDLIYDEAISKYHHKQKATKRKIANVYSMLVFQKFYSDNVTGKATVDSADVREYYRTHRDEFKDMDEKRAHSIITVRLRDEIVQNLRQGLFGRLREKYKPEINETVLVRLLKEEK